MEPQQRPRQDRPLAAPAPGGSSRDKFGLETPLEGRVYGENKRLTFAPPLWYDILVVLCLISGFLFLVSGVLLGDDTPFLPGAVAIFTSVLVIIAGIWAATSNERIAIDLRKGTYARLEGQGLRKRLTRARTSELDALVLTAEIYPLSFGGKRVIYRLVLNWKGNREPVLVCERQMALLSAGQPTNFGAGQIYHRGMRYAQLMNVPFYDNSYFHTPAPVKVRR